MSKVSSQLSITRTYDKPVREKKHLGSVPSDYYEGCHFIPQHGLGSVKHFEGNESGPRQIVRHVPVYNADGTPKMETVTETITEKTYDSKVRGTVQGVIGAATAGAVAGTLAAGPIGTVVGTLIGAAAGGVIGFRSAKDDQLKERTVTRDIIHPSMNGYNEYTIPVPEFHKDEEVDLKGYYHHFGPALENKKVGTYQQPEIAHSRPSAVKAGLLTVGAGLAVGILAALFAKKD